LTVARSDVDSRRMNRDESERARYSRHLLLPEVGAAGQQKLGHARVLIVGAGGLGSPAALYLAAAGVGHLGIVDGDRLDVSNLQRQILYDTSDIGAQKAERARERLLALNPLIDVTAHAVELHADNADDILRDYELVLDGSDRLGTRYLVNDACVLFGKMLVSAAVHRFEGQAMSYVPQRSPCYRCLFAEADDGLVPNCAEAGVLGVLPGLLGVVQATEAIKLITGIGEPLLGRLLTYDALSMRFSEFRFARRTDCAVCGDHPRITALQSRSDASAADSADCREYSVQDLQSLLAGPAADAPLLIDVRDLHEFRAGTLPGARHIPLAELPDRLDELRGERTVMFVCLSGARSLRACTIAAPQGINAGHLKGGLRAWEKIAAPLHFS
jgi:molybdopterin/thiamine biosynthesis adenylyltransferase/rhodanese-related sulfurtransferase